MPASRRIAVFLDGTWNTNTDNTNVWRMKSLCEADNEQLVYYSAGVGTQFGQKIGGGMFGFGLDQEVIAAYEWLIEAYREKDEIFILGFSRGAYTARSLSGLISKCGLLQPGAPLAVGELYDRYREANGKRTIRELKRDQAAQTGAPFDQQEQWMLTYSAAIPVKFIGVWDTVGALGIPFGDIPILSSANYQFLDTNLRINNAFAYHALAIDEHRKAFSPTLWTRITHQNPAPGQDAVPRPLSDVEQRWFVGAHANVGGGYRSDLLAQLPLKWLMAKAASHGLAFRKGVAIDGDVMKAPISDSYTSFMYGAYRIPTGWQPYYRPIGPVPVLKGDGRSKSTINETIDGSVFERWRRDPSYRPPNLAGWGRDRRCDPGSIIGTVRADDPRVAVPEPSDRTAPMSNVAPHT